MRLSRTNIWMNIWPKFGFRMKEDQFVWLHLGLALSTGAQTIRPKGARLAPLVQGLKRNVNPVVSR